MADTPKGTHLFIAPDNGQARLVIDGRDGASNSSNIKEVAAYYGGVTTEALKHKRENPGMALSSEQGLHPATSYIGAFIAKETGGLDGLTRDAVLWSAHEQLEAHRAAGAKDTATLAFNGISTKRGETVNCNLSVDPSAMQVDLSKLPALGSEQISLPSNAYSKKDYGLSGDEIDIRKHPGVKLSCNKGM